MSPAARGCYVDLLTYQSQHGRIPDDDRQICRLLSLFPDEWEAVKDEVLEKFPDGKNPRMEEVIQETLNLREKKAEAGRKGAAKRWQKDGTPNGTTNGTPNGTANAEAYATAMVSTTTVTTKDTSYPSCPKNSDSESGETPKPIKTDFSKEMLDEIWNLSPSRSRPRTSKKKVDDEWKKIKKADRPEPETVISAFQAWLKCDEWTRDGGAYVPGLHLWIKNRQWENVPEPASDSQQYRSCL